MVCGEMVLRWLCRGSEFSCTGFKLVFLTISSSVALISAAQYSNEPFLLSHSAGGGGEFVCEYIIICVCVR